MVLALLLARAGVRVTLLEARGDFERAFRGNTLGPSAMQVLDQLGLAERVLALPHARIERFVVQSAAGRQTFADFRRLPTRYPFVTMLPQARLLELLAGQAAELPNLRLLMGAQAHELISEGGRVCGVGYRTSEGPRAARAALTVGADGRFSRVRRLAGLQPRPLDSAMDVLWMHLPRRPHDPAEAGAVFRFGRGSLVVLMDHIEDWQVGYIIAKGGYARVRAAGLPALRRSIAEAAPELADRVELLRDWRQIALLSVETSRLARWHRPGLLLIGDAAHTMSPVGGVGISMAIQDAAAAAQLLAAPLRSGSAPAEALLRAVQRRRERPTRLVQGCQVLAQRWVVNSALGSDRPFCLPAVLRLLLRAPLVGQLPARLIAFGQLSP
jgi:2-polyprenyl-6-methoxyphenol hydroxylase-like FAD-dependent oxidoreductase